MTPVERSHRNMTHYYQEELLRLIAGEYASNVFGTRGEMEGLTKRGVLEPYRKRGGSRLVPTSTTLKYMREYGFI